MHPAIVTLAYGASLVSALALLYFFRARWYWHVLSLAVAIALGLTPLPPEWNLPDLLVGFVFVFLFAWGFAAPFFVTHHAHRHVDHEA